MVNCYIIKFDSKSVVASDLAMNPYLYTIDNNDIDVTAVKTQVNIILKQEEAQKEQNSESQIQETEKPVEENTETATQNDEISSSEENTGIATQNDETSSSEENTQN